jgi:hypothetical protein
MRQRRVCRTSEHGRLKTSMPRVIAETMHTGFQDDGEGGQLELRLCLRVNDGADAPCCSTIALEGDQ